MDINTRNDIGDAPIHTLVRNAATGKSKAEKSKAEKFDILWNFLVYCDTHQFDINIKTQQGGDTALHLAAEVSIGVS